MAPVDTYQCRPIAGGVVFISAGNQWVRNPITACEVSTTRHHAAGGDHPIAGQRLDLAAQRAATATDSSGNSAQSATSAITLGTPAAMMPPTDAPPQVRVDSPAAGTTLTAGGPLNIQATVHDDGDIVEVTVEWTKDGQVTTFPMHGNAGTYALQTTLSAAATAGPRAFTVTATDNAGNKTTSQSVGPLVK